MALPLESSAPLVALRTLPRNFTPGQIRGFLRQELGYRGDEVLCKALAKVQWEDKGAANSETGHGRDSMGRSVDRAVVNAQDIPEFFAYEFAPFAALPSYRCTIEIGVHLDTEMQRINLFPVGDAIAHGIDRVLADVHETLTGDLAIPVYRGSV